MALLHKMGTGQRKGEWELAENPSVPGFVISEVQIYSDKMLFISDTNFT